MSLEAVMYEWVGTVPGLGAGSLIGGGVIYGVCRLMGKKMWVVGPKGLGEIVEVNVLEWRLALGWLVGVVLGVLSYAVFYGLGLAVLAPSVWTSGLLGIGGYGVAKMLSENWVHYETSPSDEVLVAVGMQRDSFDELVSQWREQAGKSAQAWLLAPRAGCAVGGVGQGEGFRAWRSSRSDRRYGSWRVWLLAWR